MGRASIRTSYLRIDWCRAVVPVLVVTGGTTSCVRRALDAGIGSGRAVLAVLTVFTVLAVASPRGLRLTRPHRPRNATLTR